jgi:ribosomal-protein-alanine N-acetyltransferase
MQTEFLTDRLWLTSLAESDDEFMCELLNTKGWLQFIGDRKVHSKEEAVQYIKKVRATKTIRYWVARLRELQTPLGIISFVKRDYLEHFDIGFAFLPQHGGKGYAFEAAREVLNKLMQDNATVLATTLPENEKSIVLLEKLGFVLKEKVTVEEKPVHVYIKGEGAVVTR